VYTFAAYVGEPEWVLLHMVHQDRESRMATTRAMNGSEC